MRTFVLYLSKAQKFCFENPKFYRNPKLTHAKNSSALFFLLLLSFIFIKSGISIEDSPSHAADDEKKFRYYHQREFIMQIFVCVILSFFMRFMCRIVVVFGRECSRVKNPTLLQKGALGLFAMTIWDLFTRRSSSRRERSFAEPFGVKEPLECYFAFSVVDFCLDVSVY